MSKLILETGDLPVSIPVIKEELDVSRRDVETGAAARIRKVVQLPRSGGLTCQVRLA